MIIKVAGFSALLEALSFTQVPFKPVPGASGIAGSWTVNNRDTSRPATMLSGAPNVAIKPNDIPPILDRSRNAPSTRREGNPCDVEPYTRLAPPVCVFPPFNQTTADVYRYRQQQSVNLGSWFVHESWMTPSLFTCAAGKKISELDIASGWGSPTAARAVLERHWDTFINQSDFEYLASIGINTVRLPIGYWNLGPDYCQDTPFAAVADVYQNSWPRVVQAINIAGQSNIGVLVDLHGAVGSQNGQPHSGISDGNTGLFDDPENIDKTIRVLTFLIQQLSNVTNVVGIQILNEPQNVPELPDFYSNAIKSMREALPSAAETFPLYIHDGFDLDRFSGFIANRTDFVVEDHHSYFVFTPSDESESASHHTGDVKGTVSDRLRKASDMRRRNLVVDEWSCALAPESISNEPDKKQARRDFCTEQMNVYEKETAGWSFWSYKKEECDSDPGWCFGAAVGNSLPSTFFSYGQTTASQSKNQSFINDMLSNMAIPPEIDTLAKTPGMDPDAASFISVRHQPAFSMLQSSAVGHSHRFEAIHLHSHRERDTSSEAYLTEQRSTTWAAGYSDGFFAATTFASCNMSKLGFIGQYIRDSIARVGPSIVAPGTEETYYDSFIEGLQNAQAIVTTAVYSW